MEIRYQSTPKGITLGAIDLDRRFGFTRSNGMMMRDYQHPATT
jgi:hypothetical protein